MHPRTVIRLITITQNGLLACALGIMVVLPPYDALSGGVTPQLRAALFELSHITVAFVMLIRPLANLFPRARLLAQLVILRKGFGVLSASVVFAFVLARIIANGSGYFAQMLTPAYWSLTHYALLAHLGDITAFLLLLTSNTFSKRILRRNWKRLQKLAYVYFYAGTGYAYLTFHGTLPLVILIVVTIAVLAAFVKNHLPRR